MPRNSQSAVVLLLAASIAASPVFRQIGAQVTQQGQSAAPSRRATPSTQRTTQSTQQWRADLTYLLSTMKGVHPAPFHRISERTFDARARALHAAIPQLTDAQIAVRMASIVALLNDGHSRLALAAPVFRREKSFPVRIQRFADGIFVVATRPVDSTYLGARVERIGNLGALAAWDSVTTLSSGDNVFSSMANVPFSFSNPELLRELALTNGDSLVLTVTRNGSTAQRWSVAAVDVPLAPGVFFTGWSGPGGATQVVPATGMRAVVEQRRTSAYWFDEDGRQLYAQINQVGDTRDTVWLAKERAVVTLEQFGARIFQRIDAGDIDRLVIDLRFNGGGNNELARSIVNGIAARPSINQRGKLFVITGRDTYSAAMNFVSMLEDRTEALFVGEPAGGAPLHYGDAVPFTLPNSKLQLRVSTLHWDTGVRPADVRETVEPDLPAPPTFADHLRGHDAPLAAINSYTAGSRIADQMLARYRAAGLDSAFAEYDRGRATSATGPWASDVQQLLEFATAVIRNARARDDIFKAFEGVTTRYPDSHVAWFERARVHAFVNDWPAVRAAYAKALALRPQNNTIGRMLEAAMRR